MFSRIALFLAANFGVLTVLSVSSRVFGLEHWLAQQGMVLNGWRKSSSIHYWHE